MSGIKLAKLPDRMPVKLSISIMPDLHHRLGAYAHAYKETYGVEEQISDLVPAMLAAFLDGDRSFTRRQQ